MKKKIRLAVAMVLVLCTAVLAAGASQISPCWNYVTVVGGRIDIPSSILGIAEVAGHGSASTLGVDKVVCTVHLQQMRDRKWVTLKSWSTTSNSRTAAVGTKKYAVAHGYTYRVYVTLDAYKGNTHLETGEFSEVYGYFD